MQMRIMLHTVPRPARRSAMHSRCRRCVQASSTPRPAFLSDQQPVDAGMDAESTVMVHTFIFSTPMPIPYTPCLNHCLNLCHFRPCTGT